MTTMTSDVRSAAALGWEEAFAAGAEICGGKGYHLGWLHRYGFRVPCGGVVPAHWYSELLKVAPQRAMALVRETQAEDAMNPNVVSALDEIRESLASAAFPAEFEEALAGFLEYEALDRAFVAVRSSATAEDGARASFAGIHQSILNVRGQAEISRAILRCYASLWTPHAVAYRRRMKFADEDVLCAVVICEMIHAKGTREPLAAGVAFSLDPLTGQRDRIVIDAAPGSGENVVGGLVEPQRIVYRNIKGRLELDSRSGAAGLLPEERERELAHQIFRLHWAFGDGQEPQDVEWAYDGHVLWILQARPATNVRRFLPAPVAALPRYWSTANIKDAVPGVICTLSWSLLKDAVDAIAFAAASATGYELPQGAELLKRFDGRGYFELTLLQWVLYDALGLAPAEVVKSIGGHQPEIPVPGDPMKGAEGRRRKSAGLWLIVRLWGIEKELEGILRGRKTRMRSINALDFRTLSSNELARVWRELSYEFDALDVAAGLANSAEAPWEMAVEAMLKPAFGDQARSVLGKLLAGSGEVTSAEQGYAIVTLAAAARTDDAALEWLESNAPGPTWVNLPANSPFRIELERFLEEFGHRGVYEVDYLNPRWAEDPAYILDQVRYALKNPQMSAARNSARDIRAEAEAAVRLKCGWRKGILFWLVGRLRRAMAVREAAKSALIAPGLPSKRLALEIGRRLVEAGHLDDARQALHLAVADLRCWLGGWWNGAGARALAEDRARQREAWLAQDAPPDVITEAPDGRVTASPVSSVRQGETWSGIGAAPGRATGAARIIHHPNEGNLLAAGEVLVAPSTDPGWTPLFLRASAIVMASGGYLSHGAIVAREYGIPAVVNIPSILTDLRAGDRLVVDGDSGRVIREAEAHTV